MTRVAAESCDEAVACRLQRTQPQEVFVIETLSRIRLMCAAQQLRLVAEMKRRRARKHHFVAALYEAAAARTLPKEGPADVEPI